MQERNIYVYEAVVISNHIKPMRVCVSAIISDRHGAGYIGQSSLQRGDFSVAAELRRSLPRRSTDIYHLVHTLCMYIVRVVWCACFRIGLALDRLGSSPTEGGLAIVS